MRRTAQPRTVARQPLIKKAAAPIKRKNGIKTRGAYPTNKNYNLEGEFQISDTFYGKLQTLNVGTIKGTAESGETTKVILVADESGIVSNSIVTSGAKFAVLFDSDDNLTVGVQTKPIEFNGALTEGTIFATKKLTADSDGIQGLFVKVSGFGERVPEDYQFAFYTYDNGTYEIDTTTIENGVNTGVSDKSKAQYYFMFAPSDVIRVDTYDGLTVTIKQEIDNGVATVSAWYTPEGATDAQQWTGPIKYPFRKDTTGSTVYITSPTANTKYSYTNALIFDQDPKIDLSNKLIVTEEIETTANVEIMEDTWFDHAIVGGDNSKFFRYNNAAYFVNEVETACDEWIIDTAVDYTGKNIAHGSVQAMESTLVDDLTFMEDTIRVLSGKQDKNGILTCKDLDVSALIPLLVQGGDNTDSENVILPGTIKCDTFTIGKEQEP